MEIPVVDGKVKKYEIYDGITFQWFMCAGILMVGFLSSIIFGDFGMKDGEGFWDSSTSNCSTQAFCLCARVVFPWGVTDANYNPVGFPNHIGWLVVTYIPTCTKRLRSTMSCLVIALG